VFEILQSFYSSDLIANSNKERRGNFNVEMLTLLHCLSLNCHHESDAKM